MTRSATGTSTSPAKSLIGSSSARTSDSRPRWNCSSRSSTSPSTSTSTDDPEKIDYPADKAEANARWRKKVKFDLLHQQGRRRASSERRSRFGSGRSVIEIATGMAHQIDSERVASDLSDQSDQDVRSALVLPRSKRPGGHAQPAAPPIAGRDRSVAPVGRWVRRGTEIVPGMAADKDGRLQPEDKIIGIQKENGEEIDLVEKKLNDVVRHIRGPRGTKVRLSSNPTGPRNVASTSSLGRRSSSRSSTPRARFSRQSDGRKEAQDRNHQPAGLLRRHCRHSPGRSRRGQRNE